MRFLNFVFYIKNDFCMRKICNRNRLLSFFQQIIFRTISFFIYIKTILLTILVISIDGINSLISFDSFFLSFVLFYVQLNRLKIYSCYFIYLYRKVMLINIFILYQVIKPQFFNHNSFITIFHYLAFLFTYFALYFE